MKVIFKVSDKMTVELEAKTQKDIFQQLGSIQEIFGETLCGKCKGTKLRFVVRNVDDNDFYELHCLDCHAKLPFGCHKKGDTLFPKRKDDDGKYLPDNGWFKYVKPAS